MEAEDGVAKTPRIRIILIDDHSTIHRAIRSACDFWEDLDLIAQGSTGEEAILLCREHKPDVVLMDYMLAGMSGAEATRAIVEADPTVKVLALSGFRDETSIKEMIDAGAHGYLVKQSSVEDLAKAIRAINAGFSVYSDRVSKVLIHGQTSDPHHDFGLTARELEVLGMMRDGLINREIASQLAVSLSTVKYHVSSIYTKLDVKNRAEAVSLAVKYKLVN